MKKLNSNNIKSFLTLGFLFLALYSYGQKIIAKVDSTSIKIGQQITYKIEVEVDTSSLVVFPEGQTFLPLEMIESYKVDAKKLDDRFHLIKKYGLTQFDSGTYTIPRQKILIGDFEFFTDSLQVEVRNIEVDTTKQPLYDIKPITEVEKSSGRWWLYALLFLLVLAIILFLLYWFIWREKPLSDQEKVALLPPYERAKLALQELDKTNYLANEQLKDYYSELTGIIRTYIDEKVYDRALESTTEELINRLELLSDGNQIDLGKEDIKNIDAILRRADLVKFAKSKPDVALAEIDRKTIDLEIDQVKEALPEPTEEERLADLQYQEELARKKKRKKVIIIIALSVFLLITTFVGFGIHYGFKYVKDTIIGDDSKVLLEEKEWVTSEYGAPGVIITTPKVLERQQFELPEQFKDKMEVAAFAYGGINSPIDIVVTSTKLLQPQQQNPQQEQNANAQQNQFDLAQVAEEQLKELEKRGAENIITKNDQFITPNGQEGLKTFGTAIFNLPTGKKIKSNYIILGFTTQNLLQNVVLIWKEGDEYADEISERILNSIELLKLEDQE